MVKEILKVSMKNLVGIPLLTTQSQLIGSVNDPASQSILRAGVSLQAAGLAGENVKFAKKKLFLKKKRK